METVDKPFIDESLAEIVAKKKYYQPGETWESLCERVVDYVIQGAVISASAAKRNPCQGDLDFWREAYLGILRSKKFMPGGRILANAGTGTRNLANCFILSVEDSRKSIYGMLATVAEIHAQGGGCGIGFSNLREEGAKINSTGGEASGPLSFMQLYEMSADVIKQASRRGAMLGSLRADHPDIFKFIEAKHKEGTLRNFNISVLIPDDVMQAYLDDGDVYLKSPLGKNIKKVKASEILNYIAEWAWKTGDPGILFIDTLNKANPTPQLGEIVGVNPCGEVPGVNGSSCNLGSLDLTKFIYRGSNGEYSFNFNEFAYVAEIATKFMDDVVSVTETGIEIIDQTRKQERKIGLGVMGFADVLALLNIAYDSPEGLVLAEQLASTLYKSARHMSQTLARDFGTYPAYERGTSVDPVDGVPQEPQRNAALTAIAPTGTISLICNVAASIEPFYMLAYRKNFQFGAGKTTDSRIVASKTLSRILEENFTKEETAQILNVVAETGVLPTEGFSEEVNTKLRLIKPGLKTAYEISPESHLAMQAAWQRHIDLSISKTVNLPNSSTVQDVLATIIYAWKSGIKGYTVFRDGCRSEQIMERPTSS